MKPFFLFIGTTLSESSTSQLKAANIPYRQKMLESGPDNWREIIRILELTNLAGVVMKLTNPVYRLLARPDRRDLAEQVLRATARVRHITFVHESTLEAEMRSRNPEGSDQEPESTESPEPPPWHTLQSDDPWLSVDDSLDGDDGSFAYSPGHFTFELPQPETLIFVGDLVRKYSLNLVPYKRNAELSVMARSFIDQADKHLLFRVYIPEGRLWANESDKLFSLFRDWLTRVKRQRVRQDGYSTGHGRVYEFYAESPGVWSTLGEEFSEFSSFLSLCAQEPGAATKALEARNIDTRSVVEIVERYSKEARRLRVDIKHDLESKVLSIRHQLESELLDAGVSDEDIGKLVNAVVPRFGGLSSAISSAIGGGSALGLPEVVNVNVSQQIIGTVNGVAAQHFQGISKFGADAKEILALIEAHAGPRTEELVSSLHELEDDDARADDRLTAKQRLKSFLYYVGGQTGNLGTGLLQKYLELRLGLGDGS